MPITLTAKLRDEYQERFDSCVLREAKAQEVERTIGQIQAGQARYFVQGGATYLVTRATFPHYLAVQMTRQIRSLQGVQLMLGLHDLTP